MSMYDNAAPIQAISAAADYLHTHEPLTDLHIVCRQAATGQNFSGAQLMSILERANRARFIPRVGWVTNYVTGDKSQRGADHAQDARNLRGWYVTRTV